MNSSTTPRLLSPGSSTQNADSLLASSATDIQDIKSSQSDQHQMIVSPGATTTGHHLEDHRKDNAAHHDNQMRSSVKTEYKSNFTPFDQYVYNEITDSFVKQPHQRNTVSNNLLIESRNNPISASSSSQDLAAQSEAHAQHATSAVSPALEAGVFEPVNGSDANHQHDVTSEPWYMEVMKRNEKAHEYRYKSELGHNSALLNDSSIDKDLIRKSPLGNDPLIEAQILDKQQQLNSSNRTGTHEYKRDHMISHMANNNNFKLPKDPGTNSSGAPASRRVIVGGAASSSRPLSRTTAASRARSQSSKRPVTTTTTLAKNESTTKSNQTTPTKSVPSRVSATARPKATAPVAKTTSSTLSNGSGRPATASTRRPLTASTTSRVMPPKTATTAASNARTTTPVSSTRSTGLKPYGPTAAKTVPRTVPASSTTQTASKSPIKRATNTTSMSNRPSTAASRPTTTRYSGNASSAKTTKQAASGPTATSAIKSIKTKALVDAGEKTAALQANSSSNSDAGSDQKQLVPETNVSMTTKEVETQQPGSNEINVFAPATIENFDPGNPEPDLIFSTTEAGNMLADEIAQAEKFANETTIRERFEYARKASNATDPENLEAEVTSQSARDSREMVEPLHAEPTPVLESSELVNGLAGGLVSAEDRYEASEHDASLDYGAQQSGQSYAHGEQGYDHEPYSIMPTTYGDENKKNEQLPSEPTVRDASDETIIKNLDASSDESVSPSQTEKADNQMESERLNAPSDAMSKFDDDLMSSNTDGAAGNEDHNADATNEIVDNNMRNHEHTDLEILDSSKSVEHLEGDKHASEHHPDDANDDTSSAGVSTPPHPPSPAPTPLHELSTPSESEKTVFKDDQIGLMERVSSVNALDEVTNNVPDELTAMGHDLPQIATSDHTDSSNPPKQATSAVIDHESDTLATHAEQPVSETLEDTDNDHINDIVEKLEPLNFDDDLDFPGLADREDGQSVVDHEDRKEESQSHEQLTQIHRQSIVDQTETGSQTNEEIQDLEGSNMRQQASVEDQSSMDQYDGSAATCNVDNKPIDSPESKADSDDEVVVNKNELLMNVSELEAFESMKRQEMSRKSELAREQSNSSTSLTPQHASELLLSVDQLDERFAQIPTTGDTNSKQGQQEDHHNKDIVPLDDPTEIDHHVESGTLDLSHNIVGLDNLGSRNSIDATKPENSGETVVVRPDTDLDTKSSSDLLNFGSITPTNDQLLDTESRVAGTEWTLEMSKDQKAEEKYTGSKTFDIVEVTNQESSQEGAQQKPLRRESSSEPDDNMDMYQAKHEDSVANLDTNSNQATKSTTSINDDEMDEEEQLKLSNHLTNSDDDVILEPRNRKEDSFSEDAFSPHRAVSPSRYNEGAGLGMMAQEDEVGTVELADGSSAEIVAPTVAENRVEVSTSKSMMPEISQAATFIHPLKLTQEDDEYDENEDWNLNPSADPIDVAATMSPSSSVAEEMLRLSRQASLSNALAELNVSRTTGSPSEPSGIDLNETENADSTRQAGVEFARVAEIMRQGSKDDDANLLRSNSSSSSSLSSKEGHQSTHATDKAGSKTDLLVGGPELGPINNNDIDNVDNRKQNIDINSDRNSGNVKQADEMHVQGSQTTGLAAVVAAATDKADQMVAEDQAKDADVTLSSK